MQPATDKPLLLVLRGDWGDRVKPETNAVDRRTVSGDALLRSKADGEASKAAGVLGKPQASETADAEDGTCGHIPEAQHQQTSP